MAIDLGRYIICVTVKRLSNLCAGYIRNRADGAVHRFAKWLKEPLNGVSKYAMLWSARLASREPNKIWGFLPWFEIHTRKHNLILLPCCATSLYTLEDAFFLW
jgi:hypothetical protein